METTAFLVDFELVVDRPGIDVHALLEEDGNQFSFKSTAGGVRTVGSTPVNASKSSEAENAARTKIEARVAEQGYEVVSFESFGSHRIAGMS